jgi:eukaryotic-like serine/threonine-protein kinase
MAVVVDESTTSLRNPSRELQMNAPPPAGEDNAVIVDARYVLEHRLGGGGMGVVYRALDQLMLKHHDRDPYVALKLISESLRQNEEARMLLQRECSRAQKLSHPNIVRVFHYGWDRTTDSDYLTMELLRGESLEHVVRANPKGMAWARIAPAIEQLCNALEYAHAEGIVHSDIKPSNLFLTDSMVLKVLDFGIAAPMRSADTASSETLLNPRRLGAVAPRYSSLEMFLGKDADPSDDVYSAACVIYELITGKHPFQGLETPRAAELNLEPEPVKLLSRSQNKVLRKALNFRRKDRTATIAELRDGLLRSAPMMRGRPMLYAGLAGLAGIAIAAMAVTLLLRLGPGRQPTINAVTTTPREVPLERASTPAPAKTTPASATPATAPPAGTAPVVTAPVVTAPVVTTPPANVPTGGSAANSTSAPPAVTPVTVPVNRGGKSSTSPSTQTPRAEVKSAEQKVTKAPPVAAAPATQAPVASGKALTERCQSLLEHAQLGETLSEEDNTYVREKCR